MSRLSPKSAAPADLGADFPLSLAVVVDAEEEFDWTGPFSRDSRETRNMEEQHRAQSIFEQFGVRPMYVIDHPVCQDETASAWLRQCLLGGGCEIGAHLHPWVTPPYEERFSRWESYGCNLPPELERRKIAALTSAIETACGVRPWAFRAGRYGVGAETLRSLQALGYRCDLSIAPHSGFARDGGPRFYGWGSHPVWIDQPGGLLEIPVSTGFAGAVRSVGPRIAPFFDWRGALRLRLPGALARAGLIERIRITPEGVSTAELRRGIGAMTMDGVRLIVLTYHSSTLLPGATAYARTAAERDAFLRRLEETLRFFRDDLGGGFASIGAVEALARANHTASASLKADPVKAERPSAAAIHGRYSGDPIP